MNRAHRRTNPQGWIRERVAVMPDGCWLWLGALSGGYGCLNIPTIGQRPKRKFMSTHRFSYLAFRGEIPKGKVLDHVFCDQPMCCNPWHLEPRTNRENILRGTAPPAVNARRTECVNGHPLSGENLYTYVSPSGKSRRGCKECRRTTCREFVRARSAKRKAEALDA